MDSLDHAIIIYLRYGCKANVGGSDLYGTLILKVTRGSVKT